MKPPRANDQEIVFRNRADAGRQLAHKLDRYAGKPATVVLGLPRGGVVTAAEIASALGLPLDVVISRKLGAPGNPELAIGAVAEDGDPYLNDESVILTDASDAYVAAEVKRQRAEIARRRDWFRGGRPLAMAERATAILVDDGIATGATAIAAIRALRQLEVDRLVLAVPVAPPETAEVLRGLVDELVVIATPARFWAVGEFYEDFAPVSDQEVARLLAQSAGDPFEEPGALDQVSGLAARWFERHLAQAGGRTEPGARAGAAGRPGAGHRDRSGGRARQRGGRH
jgi:putative phosphoribosyl transferase